MRSLSVGNNYPGASHGQLTGASFGGRLNAGKDPAGYALQSLEAALLKRGLQPVTYSALPELALLELAPLLGKLETRQERRSVLQELLRPAITNSSYRAYLCRKLPHLLYFVPIEERAQLLQSVLVLTQRRVKSALAFAVVRSAHDKQELKELLPSRTITKVLSLKHKELSEIAAKVIIIRRFELTPFPKALSRCYTAQVVAEPKKAREKVRERLLEIHAALTARLADLDSLELLRNLRTTKEFKRGLREALKIIKPHVAIDDSLPRRRLSRYDGAQLANFLSFKVRTEIGYGVWFANGAFREQQKPHAWTRADIKRTLPAFAHIPEGHILMTPLLHQFLRGNDPTNFGSRAPTGAIWLTDQHRTDHSMSHCFGGIHSTVVVAIHEMAHAIQIGNGAQETGWKTSGELVSPADPLFDFAAFCQLSKWRVITERPWMRAYNNDAVLIDRQLLPIARPTTYRGEEVVIRHFHEPSNGGTLLSHAANAKFGLRAPANTDPWEDWAEGFCEYMLTPRRFVELSPEKFLYFHLHFRKYEESSPIVRRLQRELEARKVG